MTTTALVTKAPHPFWLDGGYDRVAVDACPHAPDHQWWVFRLGDVIENPYDPDEIMVICKGCYVPRCVSLAAVRSEDGVETSTEDRCIRPRHHWEYHRYLTHAPAPVGA